MDMMDKRSSLLFIFIISTVAFATAAFGDYQSDKMLLSDLRVITLHQGQMTNARRSSPVPQLKCVGGSAQHKFQPKTVQCINQGSDGYDIQWECKTDMDNSYRFGHVGVTCEGYDYPNDPYVLKGSCGLEYTIEFTEEGLERERKQGGNSYSNSYSYNYNKKHESEGGIGGLIVFCGILFVMYVIYKMCLAPNPTTGYETPQTEPTAPPQPPPYGFRPEFTSGQGPPPPYESCNTSHSNFTNNPAYDSHCSSSSQHSQANRGTGGGGFWSGAATGGILGYLFGSNGNRNYGYGGNRWGNSGWNSHNYGGFNSSSGGFSSSSSPRPSSSGTRTASGFGGTQRR